MTVQSLPFVPPAPAVHPKNLPVWRLLWNLTRSSISVWPDYAFDALYIRNSVMGLKTIVVSDPEGVRHVMTVNAANYRRAPAVTRFARPLGGSGLFLAEGADWRRQRRLLAPTFTPASIGLLLPHFRDAGLHLLLSVGRSPSANLSKAFQDTALEAVLRALFSMPESSDRQTLSHLVREYADGPGRPNLFDAFAKSEELLRLREQETHTFPETLVPSHRPDHLATQGLADKGGPSRSPRSVVEPRGRRNRQVVVGRRNP